MLDDTSQQVDSDIGEKNIFTFVIRLINVLDRDKHLNTDDSPEFMKPSI
jgi:hypothetical protein